jgi:hypothetical protein
MKQRLELRLSGIPAKEWRRDFVERLAQNPYTKTIEIPDEKKLKKVASTAAIDPIVLVALISSSSTIIAALIPVLIEVFRHHQPEKNEQIIIVIHGTADSNTIVFENNTFSETNIEDRLSKIGSIKGIEIRR